MQPATDYYYPDEIPAAYHPDEIPPYEPEYSGRADMSWMDTLQPPCPVRLLPRLRRATLRASGPRPGLSLVNDVPAPPQAIEAPQEASAELTYFMCMEAIFAANEMSREAREKCTPEQLEKLSDPGRRLEASLRALRKRDRFGRAKKFLIHLFE